MGHFCPSHPDKLPLTFRGNKLTLSSSTAIWAGYVIVYPAKLALIWWCMCAQTAFLHGCPSCPSHLNSTGQAVWAILQPQLYGCHSQTVTYPDLLFQTNSTCSKDLCRLCVIHCSWFQREIVLGIKYGEKGYIYRSLERCRPCHLSTVLLSAAGNRVGSMFKIVVNVINNLLSSHSTINQVSNNFRFTMGHPNVSTAHVKLLTRFEKAYWFMYATMRGNKGHSKLLIFFLYR